jgi:transposase-like protein
MSATSVTKAQMRCPRCHLADNAAVLNTRHRVDGSIRRRHVCLACRIRWTSLEDAVLGSICSAAAPAGLSAARAAQKVAES